MNKKCGDCNNQAEVYSCTSCVKEYTKNIRADERRKIIDEVLDKLEYDSLNVIDMFENTIDYIEVLKRHIEKLGGVE